MTLDAPASERFPQSLPILQPLIHRFVPTLSSPATSSRYLDVSLAALGAGTTVLFRHHDEFRQLKDGVEEKVDAVAINIGQRLRQEVGRMEECIGRLETRVDQRFVRLETRVDQRFEQVDRRFDRLETRVDHRFEQIDQRFRQLETRFEDQEAVRFNAFATRGTSFIRPVPRYTSNGEVLLPSHFPRIVFDFLRLGDLDRRKRSISSSCTCGQDDSWTPPTRVEASTSLQHTSNIGSSNLVSLAQVHTSLICSASTRSKATNTGSTSPTLTPSRPSTSMWTPPPQTPSPLRKLWIAIPLAPSRCWPVVWD